MSETSASDSGPSVDAPNTAPDSVAEVGTPRPADTSAGETTYRASYAFLIVLTVINLVADLWSKHWAKSTYDALTKGKHNWEVVVVQDAISFIYRENRGGAWGLLQTADEAVRRPFFLAVSVVAIVFIVSLYRKLLHGQTALKWGLPMVLGGALGNLVDRVRYGYVVDFIDVYAAKGSFIERHIYQGHWPTFNIADVSICVGVVLMAVDMFTSRPSTKESPSKEQADAVPPSESLSESPGEAEIGVTSAATVEGAPDVIETLGEESQAPVTPTEVDVL